MKEIYDLVDIPALLMGLANLAFVLVLVQWHVQDGPFDFRRALLDPATGSLSFTRLGQLVCLVSSTEVLFYLAVYHELKEWYLGLYMMAWAGLSVYGKWQDSQNAKNNVSLPKLNEDPKP